ncbi:uncharacterized protein LOC133294921 [Gastrolobium bilobum]|uniref:uncharacterized protein LOC133294921 n=1 Tax=Gastrolobium bilobum TaxID=150636 RepID=UPI002AB22DA8|nr:uncharacterized protein LOC133294921 [Gastrolobium bilobum]
MEEEDKLSLQKPLIPHFSPSSSSTSSTTAAAATSSSSHHNSEKQHYACNNPKYFISDNNIILRILLVLSVAIISIWANFEASKTFDINIVNGAEDSLAGQRFALSYVSNDRATRIVLNTSSFVENLLYPNKHYPKKQIDSVTLRLTRRNLNTTATVSPAGNRHHSGGKIFKGYVIDISPILLEDKHYDKMAMVGAVQRAMTRVWLWDGGSRAPPGLLDGMAEYVAELAGFRGRERVSGGGEGLPECDGHHGWWWEDKDPRHVARYLHYCEKYKTGFIQRLNEAMRDTWHDRMVDDVLGVPAMKLCGSYNSTFV